MANRKGIFYASVYTPSGRLIQTGEIYGNFVIGKHGTINVKFKKDDVQYVTHISNVVIVTKESFRE